MEHPIQSWTYFMNDLNLWPRLKLVNQSQFLSKSSLLTPHNSCPLEKTNHSTISKLFYKSLSLLWPDGVQYEDVLLFLTDAAPYMCLAAEGLKLTFPKMIYLTFLAHGLHRVAEKIRILNPQVNKLISNVKKIFTKAPLKINYFAEKAPGTPLPPKPILTRWGTWLSAVNYYSKNYEIIKNIIDFFDEDDCWAIKKAQSLFKDSKDISKFLIKGPKRVESCDSYDSKEEVIWWI